jgi:hypothetical protein
VIRSAAENRRRDKTVDTLPAICNQTPRIRSLLRNFGSVSGPSGSAGVSGITNSPLGNTAQIPSRHCHIVLNFKTSVS